MLQKESIILLLFCFSTLIIDQICATKSSAGSVPDEAFTKTGRRSKVRKQEVPKATLGENSANSLSPSGKKPRKSRALTSSATSKKQKRKPISTDLKLSSSHHQHTSGPKNAIKKEVGGTIGHARYRLLKGINQNPTTATEIERATKMEQVRKFTSGELSRQIREADQRKKQIKTEQIDNISPPKKNNKTPSGSDETGKSKGLDLNLRLRRRAISSDSSNGSTVLRLGNSNHQRITNRGQIQPSSNAAQSHSNNPVRNAQQTGGPLRRGGRALARLQTIRPYNLQKAHHTNVRYISVHPQTDRERQTLADRYRSFHLRKTPQAGLLTYIHSPTPIRIVPVHLSQPVHRITPISPGSQNLIDRIGHSSSYSAIQHQSSQPGSDENHNSLNLNLSLGS